MTDPATDPATDALPRHLVALALDVSEESLPEGDLPLERLAQRFLMFLRATEDDDHPEDHPEVWTAALASHLAEHQPRMSLALMRRVLAEAQTPEDLEIVAGGPLSELMEHHGTDLLPEIDTLAARAPRFKLALGALAPQGGGSLLWARLSGLAQGGEIDDDTLPGPTGLGPGG